MISTIPMKRAKNIQPLLFSQDLYSRSEDYVRFVEMPTVFSDLPRLKPTKVFDTYWYFAAERQRIFLKRFLGKGSPWTQDPILGNYKFTNAYRASDRVSQYLIQKVIYDHQDQTPKNIFFRIMLFKFFNKIETWESLEKGLGREIHVSDNSFEQIGGILSNMMERGEKIFSSAYIMPSGGKNAAFSKKHRNLLVLLERMLSDELYIKLADAKSLEQAFKLIRSYPMMGDFLAYQYMIDINYSNITNFSENDFIVAGPGALDGISKCFVDMGGMSPAEIIERVTLSQSEMFEKLGIDFQNLWGRKLHLIDCQNLFCEISKYSRVAHPDVVGISGRTRIKHHYSFSKANFKYWYPPKWGINQNI